MPAETRLRSGWEGATRPTLVVGYDAGPFGDHPRDWGVWAARYAAHVERLLAAEGVQADVVAVRIPDVDTRVRAEGARGPWDVEDVLGVDAWASMQEEASEAAWEDEVPGSSARHFLAERSGEFGAALTPEGAGAAPAHLLTFR